MPAPRQFLEAVRAVFEHANFIIDHAHPRPVGTDLIVHPFGKTADRFAVACFPDAAAADTVSSIANAARRAGIPHIQVITTAPIPAETVRAAQETHILLTDAEGFEAAVQALPEDVRLRLGCATVSIYPNAAPAPAPKPVPTFAEVLYDGAPVIAVEHVRSARKGPSLPFLITMGIILVTAAAVTFNTVSKQMEMRKRTAMRHAENIASIAGAAKAAGHDFLEMTPDKTPRGVAESVARGAVITEESSPFFGVLFGVDMTAREVLDAVPYLAIERGELVFRPGHAAKEPGPDRPSKPLRVKPQGPERAPQLEDESAITITETPARSLLIVAPIPITAETPSWNTHCRPVMKKYLQVAWNFAAIQEPEAQRLAGGLLDFHTGTPLTLSREESTHLLRKYSSRYPALFLASLAWVDPLYLRDLRMESVTANLETMLRNEPHLPLLEWQLAGVVAGKNPSPQNSQRALAALSKMLDHTKGLTSVPDFIGIRILLEGEFCRDFFALEHELMAGAVWDHAQTPEWLKELVIGQHHRKAAAKLAAIIDVSPESRQAEALEFKGHVDRGLAALTSSWNANPNVPETAAAMMMMVALDGGKKEQWREWFNRAVKLRADCREAYANQLELLTARKDFKGLQEFGASCLATGRFDTHVPNHFFDSHHARAQLTSAPAQYWVALPSQELSRFEEYFRGLKMNPDSVAWREFNHTRQALYHLWRGEAAVMEQCLAGLKGPHETALQHYGMTMEQFQGAADNLRRLQAKISPSVSPDVLRTPASER